MHGIFTIVLLIPVSLIKRERERERQRETERERERERQRECERERGIISSYSYAIRV